MVQSAAPDTTLEPTVGIWASGKIAISKPAVDEWFHGTPAVNIYVHDTQPHIILEPTDDTEKGYTLQKHTTYQGRVIDAYSVLRKNHIPIPGKSTNLRSWVSVVETIENINGPVVVVNYQRLLL